MDSYENSMLNCRYMTTIEAAEFFLDKKLSVRSMPMSLTNSIILAKLAWKKPQLNGLVMTILEELPLVGYMFKLLAFVDASHVTQKVTLEDLIFVINLAEKTSKRQLLENIDITDLPPTLSRIIAQVKGEDNKYNIQSYVKEIMDYPSLRYFGNPNTRSYLRQLTLMLVSIDAGLHKQALFYARCLCQRLYETLSYRELVGLFDEVYPILKSVCQGTPENFIEDITYIGETYAKTLFNLGEYASAKEVYEALTKTDNLSRQMEFKRKVVRCYERLGNSNVNTAIEKGSGYLKGLHNQDYAKAKLLRTLGWTYISLGKAKEALECSMQAKSLFMDLGQKKKEHFLQPMDVDIAYNLARTHNNIGAAYELLGKGSYKKSIEAHHLCKRVMQKLSRKWYSGSLLNLSIVYRKEKSLKKSVDFAFKAKQIKDAICDYDDLPPLLFNYAFSCILYALQLRKEEKEVTSFLSGSSDSASYLETANQLIFEGISLRESQKSDKTVIALYCLGALVQLISPSNKQIRYCDYFKMKSNFNAGEFESDKKSLFNKVFFILSETGTCDCAYEKEQVNKESELGESQLIIKCFKERDA